MDPASIVALVSASVGLAVKCGTVAADLNILATKYKQAELTIEILANKCQTLEVTLKRIKSWLDGQEGENIVDDDVLVQLGLSVEIGFRIISALEEDFAPFIGDGTHDGFRDRVKIVWNDGLVKMHDDRVADQLNVISCLLKVMKIPSTPNQRKALTAQSRVFRKAESSAWTIVNSKASDSVRDTDSVLTVESSDLVYKRLSFEDLLFTAAVYKRNYRPRVLEHFFHQKKNGRLKASVALKPSTNDVQDSVVYTDSESEIRPPAVGYGLIYDTVSTRPQPSPSRLIGTATYHKEKAPLDSAKFDPSLYEEFFKACRKNDLGTVSLMIEQGANVKRLERLDAWRLGVQAMHIAAQIGGIELAKTLLRAGACIDDADNKGLTPLHEAAWLNNTNMVSFLLDHGASPGSKTREGLQPIHLACRNGNSLVANRLIRAGSSVTDVTNDGLQPIHIAAQSGAGIDVFELLLKNGSDINAVFRSPYEKMGVTPLGWACLHEQVENVKGLISLGAGIEPDDPLVQRPLLFALPQSNPEILKILIASGADIHKLDPGSGSPLLHNFMKRSNQRLFGPELITILVSYGLDIQARDGRGRQALHIAAGYGGSYGLIITLLKSGAQVNAIDNDGLSALHHAVKCGNLSIVESLLANGATVGLKSIDGKEPLHLAHEMQGEPHELAILETLLANGANIDALDNSGDSSLHLAVGYACDRAHEIDTMEFLVTHGANIHIKNNDGRQALHIAVVESWGVRANDDLLSLLLKNGADLNALDYDGKSALSYAVEARSARSVKFLIDRGAIVIPAGENSPYTMLESNRERDDEYIEIRRLLDGGTRSPPVLPWGEIPEDFEA